MGFPVTERVRIGPCKDFGFARSQCFKENNGGRASKRVNKEYTWHRQYGDKDECT